MGGLQAELVICDGAPDVAGLHVLDAHLHAQLLLAVRSTSRSTLSPLTPDGTDASPPLAGSLHHSSPARAGRHLRRQDLQDHGGPSFRAARLSAPHLFSGESLGRRGRLRPQTGQLSTRQRRCARLLTAALIVSIRSQVSSARRGLHRLPKFRPDGRLRRELLPLCGVPTLIAIVERLNQRLQHLVQQRGCSGGETSGRLGSRRRSLVRLSLAAGLSGGPESVLTTLSFFAPEPELGTRTISIARPVSFRDVSGCDHLLRPSARQTSRKGEGKVIEGEELRARRLPRDHPRGLREVAD